MKMNYKMIAIQIGEIIKWNTSVNEINRIAKAIFTFDKRSFPHDSITAVRAQLLYDWIMSLASEKMNNDERNKRIIQFCKEIAGKNNIDAVIDILSKNGLPYNLVYKDELDVFLKRDFHSEVNKHCRELFLQGNYFHAVFEAAKAYNYLVKDKSNSEKDGVSLMMDVLSVSNGVLKITKCVSETDRNVQEGVKFLSSGLMQAIRNPTAHEPAATWPISKQDCLDILSFISFLFRQLDSAQFFKV